MNRRSFLPSSGLGYSRGRFPAAPAIDDRFPPTSPSSREAPAATDIAPAADGPPDLPSSQEASRVVSFIAKITRLGLVLLCIGLFLWMHVYESSNVRRVPSSILITLLVLSSFGILFSSYAIFRIQKPFSVIPMAIMWFANAAILVTSLYSLVKDKGGSLRNNWNTIIFLVSGLLILLNPVYNGMMSLSSSRRSRYVSGPSHNASTNPELSRTGPGTSNPELLRMDSGLTAREEYEDSQ